MKNTFTTMQEAVAHLRRLPAEECAIKAYTKRRIVCVKRGMLLRHIDNVASALQRLGLAGERVALYGANSYGWLLHFMALQNAGSVAVLLDNALPTRELMERMRRTNTRALIFDPDNAEIAWEIAKEMDIPIFLMDPDEDLEESCLYELPGEGMPVYPAQNPGDLACIMFTSGTTGASKAVKTAISGVMTFRTDWELEEGPYSFLAITPFHHVAGWSFAFDNLLTGRPLYLADGPQYLFKAMELFGPEATFITPKMLSLLSDRLVSGEGVSWLSALRLITVGSAAVPGNLVGLFGRHGITLVTRYGMTETAAAGTWSVLTEENPNTLGKKMAGIEMDLRDGEIVFRGDAVLMGYEGVDNTETFDAEGWFHSGDLAVCDENGYYYMVGRSKNLIILSNGENISPEKIEQELLLFEEIKGALVVEENDHLAVKIILNLLDTVDEAEEALVRERVRGEIAAYNRRAPLYEQITYVHFQREDFPRNSLGKIVR